MLVTTTTGVPTSVDPSATIGTTTHAVPRVGLRTGIEIELLAPRGTTRGDLAQEIAARHGGRARPVFHLNSETSRVPGMSHFLHLSQGFTVEDADGAPLCRLVDDITIVADLDRRARPRPGWFRILCDEPRLMRLVDRAVDPTAPLEQVLDPVADLFGVRTGCVDGVRTVEDAAGLSVAMAAPLPGERERVCEIITPPLDRDHAERLEALLRPTRDLGFVVPHESAVHVHVDAPPLREVTTFANLVRLFSAWREPLRTALRTNPACTRLAPLPPAVVDLVEHDLPGTWDELADTVAPLGLVKYADVNLTSLVRARRGQDTVEVRILPGSTSTASVLDGVHLVERLLRRCREAESLPAPWPGAGVEDLLRP